MLTSLALEVGSGDNSEKTVFPGLAPLTGLSHLEVGPTDHLVTAADLACLSSLTRLTGLCLKGSYLSESLEGSSALAPLTGLVCLALMSEPGISLLPSLNIEAFQSLSAVGGDADASVLRRATGLTHLRFRCVLPEVEGEGEVEGGGGGGCPDELLGALAGMSRLRCLDLDLSDFHWDASDPDLSTILQALPSLTKLKYSGKLKVDRDMDACASLPCLRSLEFWNTQDVTPACLPALQAMTGLTELALKRTGISEHHLTPEVGSVFDVERFRRGWPYLKLVVSAY
jgi:hypothetical protein